MCSFKAWIWLTVIYSIPLILFLMFGDIISLIGLNAPKLISYDLSEANLTDEKSKPGEAASFRIAYESQFRRNFNSDNSLEDSTLTTNLKEDQLNEPNLNDAKQIDEIKDDSTNELTNNSINSATKDNLESAKQDEVVTTTNDNLIDQKKNEFKTTNDETKEDKKGNDKESDEKERIDENDKENDKEKPKPNRSEILKHSWNEFLNGLFLNDRKHTNTNKVILNIFVAMKLGFRILSLITLPLLLIGNHTNRSTYIKPFKMLLFIQFMFSIGITIYYAIVSTEVGVNFFFC